MATLIYRVGGLDINPRNLEMFYDWDWVPWEEPHKFSLFALDHDVGHSIFTFVAAVPDVRNIAEKFGLPPKSEFAGGGSLYTYKTGTDKTRLLLNNYQGKIPKEVLEGIGQLIILPEIAKHGMEIDEIKIVHNSGLPFCSEMGKYWKRLGYPEE